MNYSLSLVQKLRNKGISDQAVLDAIEQTPRHYFVSEAFGYQAYNNVALPIGCGQTISQPYMVARMTSLLNLHSRSRVLEIGTGSGYQTCILARLVEHVYSVERVKSLQMSAKRRFRQLELYNISTKHGDGWNGWSAKGPFDAIIVTAAAEKIPQILCDQLSNNGVMVLPVGKEQQTLCKVTRKNEQFHVDSMESVRFVPLIAGDLA